VQNELPGPREHLPTLFDRGSPVVEYGADALPLSGGLRAPGDGVVVACGEVHGAPAMAIVYDRSEAASTHGRVGHAKVQRGLELARESALPVVVLAAGGRPRVDEQPYYGERRDVLHQMVELSGRVPLVGVALGPVSDTRALLLGLCDVVIGTRLARISLSGADDDDLPEADGADVEDDVALERSGALDLLVDDDAAAIAAARRYLHLVCVPLVDAVAEVPEVADALRAVVPENPRRAIDGRRLSELVADQATLLVLRARFGGSVQTSLARIGGRTVGIVASHSMVAAGALDSPASAKLARFLDLCDCFGLPVVQLVDIPGLLVGPPAEGSALIRHSTRPLFTQSNSRVPYLTVVVRRAYGHGASLMGAMSHHLRAHALLLLWPSANFGAMGLQGAAELSSRSSSRQADAESGEIHAELVEHGSATQVAARFEADEVIDPGETRERLVRAIRLLPLVTGPREPARGLEPW
jgi:acetyl-CoA carboxylase carboxyltransferase component